MNLNMYLMKTHYKALLLACITGLFNINAQAQTDCGNVGFESNAFTNWQGYTGVCCPINTATSGLLPDRHAIVTGAGFDPIIPSIPLVSPYGGTYSVKLGNEVTGAQAEKLTYSYTVTPYNTNFTYQYAVILQDPNHATAEQPRFEVKITDQSNAIVPAGYYFVIATANIPGFQDNGMGVIYKNWSQVAVDLTAYIGQTLTITFQTGDCDLGGHYGYAYIDASCIPLEVECDYCLGDTSAEMEAPQGFQYYLWSNGDTTASTIISHPIPGSTYTVTCKPFHDNSVPTVLSYIFPQSLPFAADFTVTTNCNNTSATLLDSSTLINNNTQLTAWEWKVNGAIVSTQQQPVYDFTQAGTYNIEVIVKDAKGCADTNNRQVVIPEPMVVQPAVATSTAYHGYGVSCGGASDGTAQVTIDNGELPYAFDWSITNAPNADAVANLEAGSYTVTVTDDAGCEVVATVQLTTPPVITASPVAQNVLCFGESTGSIALNATGGAGALSYSWQHNNQLTSASISNLGASIYNYTITDANGCSVTGAAVVDNAVLSELQAAPIATDISCAGASNGGIALNVGGGTGLGTYTYTWAHNNTLNTESLTGLSVGLYTVTVTDANNCSIEAMIDVWAPQAIATNPTVVNSLCFGSATGSVDLHTSGGTGSLTTGWAHDSQLNSDVAQNLAAGTYTVTISDENACTLSTSVSVTQPALGYTILNTLSDATAFGECDGTISLTNVTGNTSPYTYTWSTTPVQSSNTASQLCAGIYTVTVTDLNNCTTTATFAVTEPLETGISAVNELSAVSIWPNPHKEALQLNNVPQGTYSLRVSNTIGQQVLSLSNTQPDAAGNIKLNMEAQAKGIYFITLSNSTSSITIQAVKE